MKKVGLAFTTLVAAIGISHGASAATITLEQQNSSNEARITISGEIMSEDFARFKEIALRVEHAVVYLDSPGGDLGTSIKIGRLVRAMDFFTAVEETTCASGCALIWLAGQFKFLSTNARVGFHLPYYQSDQKSGNENVSAIYALSGAYLASLGYSEASIALMSDTPSDQIRWVNQANSKYFGVSILMLNK